MRDTDKGNFGRPVAAAAEGSKRGLRTVLRTQRLALSPAERMSAAEAVADQFHDHHGESSGHVAGYWAINGELPLHALQMRLKSRQIWCLPIVQENGSLRFGPWRPGDALVSNRFGIPEPDLPPALTLAPSDMAVVLLPLLGFTRLGQRLGMGGGYYDRSFGFRVGLAPPPLLLGIGYARQELSSLTVENWDVPLDGIINELEWIDCRR